MQARAFGFCCLMYMGREFIQMQLASAHGATYESANGVANIQYCLKTHAIRTNFDKPA